MALSHNAWKEARGILQDLLSSDDSPLQKNDELRMR